MDIVAAPGRLVRDPATRRAVGTEPISIDPTQADWARLLADDDVVEAPEHAAEAEPEPAEPEEKVE